MDELEQLRSLPFWQGTPEIARLAGGRTNRNFHVTAEGASYFARLGADLPWHGIERTAERHAQSLAAGARLAPDVLHHGDRLLVTRFVQGKTLSKADITPDRLAAIAMALRRLHQIPASGLRPFSLVEASRFYLAQLPDADLPAPRARIETVLDALPDPAPACLVHGDLIPENFIETAGGLVMVDWEYAGAGAPETDLALVISNFELDELQTTAFVTVYGAASMRHVMALKDAAAIREALWCLVQARHVEPDGAFRGYMALCARRLGVALR